MYDFATEINRRNTGSYKWELMDKEVGDITNESFPMSTADMEFYVAPEITEAIITKAKSGVYGYTGPTESYYKAVLGWQQRRHNWNPKKEWLSLTPGVVSAFFTAVKALTHPGDKVIIQSPVYYPFAMAVQRNGCEIVENPLVQKDNKYFIDFEDLEKKAADPRVKCLLFCSPHNPVGRVWTKDELKKVSEICAKNDVVVIADEIHNDIICKPYTHTVFASISEQAAQNCLVLTAPSKTFNLAGLQTSNVFIPNPKIKEQFDIAQENIASIMLNIFGYTACEAAYDHAEKWLDEFLDVLDGNKKFFNDFMAKNLPQLPVTELEGTYLIWFDCRPLGMNCADLEKFFRSKARIAFDEGYLFGTNGSGFERINLACPRTLLERCLNSMKKAIDSLH